MRDMSLSYRSGPRDPFRIANGFEDNDAIPMAIIMDVDGDLILTAGNTRLSCAKICNITPYPKVLIIPGMVSMNEAFNLKTLGLAAGMTAASIGGYNHYNNKVEEPNISINEPNSIDNPSKVSNEQLNRICKSSLKRMPESIHGLLPDSEWNKIKFIYKDSDVAGYYDLDNPYTIVISDTRIVDAVVWHESLHFAQMKLYPKVLNGMKNFKYESKYGDQNNKYLGMDDLSKAIGIANNLRASGKSMKDLNVEAQAELVTNYGVYKYLLDNERDPKYIKIWKSRLETFTPWIQDYKDPFWKNNMKPSDVSLYEKIMNLLYRIF
jgi:hypothetical protein